MNGKARFRSKLTRTCRGERGVGKWTIVVKDAKENEYQGTWIDWHLKLWGEAVDASRATKLPMPQEDDDNDHANIATTTIAASITSIVHPTDVSDPQGNPEDHIDRPENMKSTSTDGSEAEQTGSPTEGEVSTGTGEAQSATSSPSNWISWLPSFGVSSHAQMWIYGAMGLIIAFCCGLGIYLWLARRKRLRNNPRSDYEFELLNEEEAEGLEPGEKGVLAGRKGRRTRGGELYDAFAGGSDEEDDFHGGYHDRPPAGEIQDDDDDENAHHVLESDDDDDDDEEEDQKPESQSRLLGSGR